MSYYIPYSKPSKNASLNFYQVDLEPSYYNNNMSPIKIDNDGGDPEYINWSKAASLPWCTEINGTYYIENLTIYVSGYGHGITIRDSNVNFIIRNCTLRGSYYRNSYSALYLINANNGIISTNSITSDNFANGISLSNSHNNVIANNTCSINGYIYGTYYKNGISLSNSHDNVIANNSCFNNGDNGIFLSESNYNTIANNTCSNNDEDGISLSNSDEGIISNNSCSNNDEDGISISNSDEGIISNNSCSNNDNDGIFLNECNYNIIANNTCHDNGENGILITASDYNKCSLNNIWRNIVSANGKNGLAFIRCINTNILNNTCFSNIEQGIYMENSNSTFLENNRVYFNIGTGVYLRATNPSSFYNITIFHNLITYNTLHGIYLSVIRDFNISQNEINHNSKWSIFMNYCSNFTSNYNNIWNNTIDSNRYGILLFQSVYTKISQNNITNNIEYGIYLQKSSNYNVIINNYLSNNGVYCICYEEDCINNVFNNPGCIPVQIQLPDDPPDDPNPNAKSSYILEYLYPTLFVLVFIGMISGLGYYSFSKRKKWRESGIEVDQYGTIIFREERNLYENYESEKPKIITPKEVKPYEFYCFSCKKKFIGHQVFCPECGKRMKIFDPSIVSSLYLKKERNNLNKCVLCHQSTCPTCTIDISVENACFEECPYCESIYHKHCWDIMIQKFGRCAFCLESPPQELINSVSNSNISDSQREVDQSHN